MTTPQDPNPTLDGVQYHAGETPNGVEQFIRSLPVQASIISTSVVPGTSAIYAIGAQVGDPGLAIMSRDNVHGQTVVVIDPEGVLDPDQIEVWFVAGDGVTPVLPGDGQPVAGDASWDAFTLVVIPAGGYVSNVIDATTGKKVHRKLIDETIGGDHTHASIFIKTLALTITGYASTAGPSILLAGQGYAPDDD